MTLSDLTKELRVQALRSVALEWINRRGLEAFCVIEEARRRTGVAYDNSPDWLRLPSQKATDELDQASKVALEAILRGDDAEAKGWVKKAILEEGGGQAQSAELTLSIICLTLVGLVLAARVKKVGSIEFGPFPKELVEFLREARKIILPWQS